MKKLMLAVCACVCALGALANTYYVTPNGTGDGTSWGNAFGSIQSAIDAAGTEPSTVYLLHGDYPLAAQLSIAAGADIAFIGGCTGEGTEVGEVKSVLIRDAAVASMRLLNVTGATASFSDMVFRGGRLNPANSYGHGVNSANSTLVFERCDFDDNGVSAGTGNGHRGGGLAADGGSVRMIDCAFTNNRIVYNSDNGQYGAGIWAKDVELEASGCLFATNSIYVQHFRMSGGAIYATGGSALITNCVFNGNYVTHGRGYDAASDRVANGGALYFSAVESVKIVDSVFDGNYAQNKHGGITEYSGGTIYLAGAASKTEIERCVFRRSGWWAGSPTEGSVKYDNGSITLTAGSLSLGNCLIADTHANAFEIAGGTLAMTNITVVGGDREPFLQKGGGITVGNAIVWDNQCASGGVLDAVGGTFDITYSDIQIGVKGLGNFTADPRFADTTYYHLKSRAGHYDGGWFRGGEWILDAEDSPAIDAAAASDSVGDEQQPNGHRANIGYDAGTFVATKTYLGEPAVPAGLAMYIWPLSDLTADSFTVSGEFGLSANGSAAVTAYWGAADCGMTEAGWTGSVAVGTAGDWTLVSKTIDGLSGEAYVRLKADDGVSVAWSAALKYTPASTATLSDVSITHLMRNTLKARGTLASDGGAPASVRIRYWTDDESQATVIDYDFGNPVAVGESFSIDVAGLEPGATYHYAVEAVNSVGVSGETREVTTRSTTDPLVIYVSTTGAGIEDGSNWENAFSRFQDALDVCKCAGDHIHLAAGDYTVGQTHDVGELSRYFTFDAAGLTVSGDPSGGTVLLPGTAAARLFHAKNATVTFNDITFRGGRLNDANSYGHGFYGENSALVFNRCTFDDNGVSAGQGNGHYGGGLAANGGSVKLNDCAFTKNRIVYNSNNGQYGAGIWAKNVELEASGCLFATNSVYVQHFGMWGGAIYATGGSALITNCVFNGNYVEHGRGYDAAAGNGANGGAIYFSAVAPARIVDSVFDGNYAQNKHGGLTTYSGGTIYLDGAAGKAELVRCVVYRGGRWAGSPTEGNVIYDSGSITLAAGSLSVVNTLIAGMHANVFEVAGGTLSITNVTIAAGDKEPFLQKGGAITVVNAIIWGNQCADVSILDTTGGSFDVAYSDVQGGMTGMGNFAEDPLFADTTYCHVKSRAGHYDGGWFTGGSWVADAEDSPTLDVAAASDPVGDEPQPNKHLLNIGYDGGTPVASKSYLGEPAVPTALTMYIYPLADLAETSFTVSGEFGLSANGTAAVTVYWGATDGGTDAGAWANSAPVATVDDWTLVSMSVDGLSGKTYVRLKADDGTSVAWSDVLDYAPITRAELSDVSITHLMRNTLKAHGTLASNGGAPTSVRIRYWTDDEFQATIVDYNFGKPVATGTTFSIDVAGLEPGVTYHYAIEAVNSAGASGETQELTTRSLTEPITVYVTTTGAGIEDGSNWENAFARFQDALDVCKGAGDHIHLAAGDYTAGQTHDAGEFSRQFTFGAAGLTVSGDPNGGTVLLPGAVAVRLFHAKDAVVTFNDVTFRGGRLNYANSYGHGVYGENSALVFNRCTFDDNGVSAGQGDGHRGGGLAANGGSVKLNDCAFTNNRIDYNGSGGQYGAGIWAKNVTLEAAGCLFATNSVYVQHFGSWGGAIYANGGSALITNCVFNGNYVMHNRDYDAQMGRPANGGAIYFDAVPSATVVDSAFDGNYANNLRGDASGYHRDYSGGTIFLAGAAGVATIERCKILRGGWWGGSPTEANVKNDNGSICIAAGTASVVNCLVTGMHSNAFEVAGGTLAITNVTVVGSDREPVLQKGGTLSVVNSIFWDNASETGASFDLKGGTTEVSHSDVAGGFAGEGNLDTDPLLYGPTKKRAYHLRAGSPCAGKGDASGWTAADTDLDGLPRLRGSKVDLGCYSFNAPGFMLMLK